MKLSEGRAIVLFRFHDNPEAALERLKIIQHFNPSLPRYALYGGSLAGFEEARVAVSDYVENVWRFPGGKSKKWKWKHTDLILKRWFREIGSGIDFDFLYSYEYDLLTLEPLLDLYPNIDDNSVALSAATRFTQKIENSWDWTTREPYRSWYLEFSSYIKTHYGISRQKLVSLGPGPLLSRKFLVDFVATEDLDLVHDELAYPAYAEALGFEVINNQLHPGFGASAEETQYFNCDRQAVSLELIRKQLARSDGRRAFHPVKYRITLKDLGYEQ